MDNELYHHGIKGQKWGVRRYQNKDGSLTNAGRRRAAKLENEYERVTGKKVSKLSGGHSSDKKSVRDMTEDELREKTNRLRLEKDYIEAQKNHIQTQQQLSALQPKKVNKGKELAEKMIKDVVAPKVVDLGTKYIEKKLGLKDNSLDALKKEAEKAGYQKKIYEAKDAAYKNLKNEREEAKYQDNLKKNEEEAKKAEKEAKKNEKEKVYSRTVEGEGTSRRTEKSKFSTDDYVDDDFREINKSDINNGQNFINSFLLEDKNMKHSDVGVEAMNQNELCHHGIKGQKWGVRRYQNKDGSLTNAGRRREAKRYTKTLNSLDKHSTDNIGAYMRYNKKANKYANKGVKYINKHDSNPTQKDAKNLKKIKDKMIDANTHKQMYQKTYQDMDSKTWQVIAVY